jgi:hypothetical protein
VKWKLTRGGSVLESPTAYLVPATAIDFACGQFARGAHDIWIEGPNGIRIERDAIARSCRDQGPRAAASAVAGDAVAKGKTRRG